MREFKTTASDPKTKARVGELKTTHGTIETPCFIPDATYGAVKHLSSLDLKDVGLQMVLGNIYHLGIRPGVDLIKKMGGLRKFMNWDGPVLTDSGGWQVFSLVYKPSLILANARSKKNMGRVLSSGVEFKDHISGEKHFLSPEESIRMQLAVDSDILMVLDYPISPQGSKKDNERSVNLTIKWAKIGKEYFQKRKEGKGKILMAIIQGANDQEMRKKCYQQLKEIGFAGYGFGGPPTNRKILKYTADLIPDDRIRYLMGGGPPRQIIEAVSMGWDLFDCVVPTRNARHGLAYTFSGKINIKQKKYRLDKRPIEKDCPCFACRNHSRAYIRHLLNVKEPLGERLMTIHNLTFYMRLMRLIREKIKKRRFADLLKSF